MSTPSNVSAKHQNVPAQNRSVDDSRSSQAGPCGLELNVATNERIISLCAGTAIALMGLKRRSTFGSLLVAAGGMMIYRGATGHCPVYSSMDTNTADDDSSTAPRF